MVCKHGWQPGKDAAPSSQQQQLHLPSTSGNSATKLSTLQFANENYNAIYVSDHVLNKLMRIGRVQIINGQMFHTDFDEEK